MKEKSKQERLPVAIYRVPLASESDLNLGFEECLQLLPYIDSLGFTTISIGPIFQTQSDCKARFARQQTISKSRIRKELGGEEAFANLTSALDKKFPHMSLVIDLEPRFVSFSAETEYVNQILLHGPCASAADYFEIDWCTGRTRPNTLAVPILGESYFEALTQNHLRFEFDKSICRFSIYYFNMVFPVCPRSLSYFFLFSLSSISNTEYDKPEIRNALARFETKAAEIPAAQLISRRKDRFALSKTLLKEIKDQVLENRKLGRALEFAALELAKPAATEVLHSIVFSQPFQFFSGSSGSSNQNYISLPGQPQIIAVKLENKQAFEFVHAATVALLRTRSVIGLRISSFDKIQDPISYLSSLAAFIDSRTGRYRYYIWPEKDVIEAKNPIWASSAAGMESSYLGTEFLSFVTRFFSNKKGIWALKGMTRQSKAQQESIELGKYYEARRHVLLKDLSASFEMLAQKFLLLSSQDPMLQDHLPAHRRKVLTEFVICQLSTRYYFFETQSACSAQIALLNESMKRFQEESVDYLGFCSEERHICKELHRNCADLLSDTGARSGRLLNWVSFFGQMQIVLCELWELAVDEYLHANANGAIGFADTSVTPFHQSVGASELHQYFMRRSKVFSYSVQSVRGLNTRLSADSRCRLAQLSEISGTWQSHVLQWNECNRNLIPTDFVETFENTYAHAFYQTFYAIFSGGLSQKVLSERMMKHFRKTLREGRTHTNFKLPNAKFESDFLVTIEKIIMQREQSSFYVSFKNFFKEYAFISAHLGLCFNVLHAMAPGIPEVLCGDEILSFKLSFPDSKNGTDCNHLFKLKSDIDASMGEMNNEIESDVNGDVNGDANGDLKSENSGLAGLSLDQYFEEILRDPLDDRAKLFIVTKLMHLRRRYPRIFLEGGYFPLEVTGQYSGHLFAFMRVHPQFKQKVMVIVSRGLTALNVGFSGSRPSWEWSGHQVHISGLEGTSWTDIFTGYSYQHVEKTLHLGLLLRKAPFACLVGS